MSLDSEMIYFFGRLQVFQLKVYQLKLSDSEETLELKTI